MAKTKNFAQTQVILGWVVKKRYRKVTDGEFYEKTVSNIFLSNSAATIFKNIAATSYVPVDEEIDVEFYVTDKPGFENIPAGA